MSQFNYRQFPYMYDLPKYRNKVEKMFFLDQLNKKGPQEKRNRLLGQLYTVEDDVMSAVEQLVKTTWQQQHVGHGKDGVGLSHTGVQVSVCLSSSSSSSFDAVAQQVYILTADALISEDNGNNE